MWVLYMTSKKEAAAPTADEQLRVPITGGIPHSVLTAKLGAPFRCAKAPAKLCAIAERSPDNKQLVLTAFDPIAGRGSELTRLDGDLNANYSWDLSPDGTRIAFVRSAEAPIRIFLLKRGSEREITPSGWTTTESLYWAADGKALLISGLVQGETALLLVDLEGYPGQVSALVQRT